MESKALQLDNMYNKKIKSFITFSKASFTLSLLHYLNARASVIEKRYHTLISLDQSLKTHVVIKLAFIDT